MADILPGSNRSIRNEPGPDVALRPAAPLVPLGRFFLRGSERFYVKALRIAGPTAPYGQLSAVNVNTVWLSDPTPERLDFFASQDIGVVAQLDWQRMLADAFTGSVSPNTHRARVAAVIHRIRHHPGLLGYDLGGPVDDAVARWLGDRGLKRELRAAFRFVKEIDPRRAVTATVPFESAHLNLGFLDFLSFQLTETDAARFRIALSRLQHSTLDLPLVLHAFGANSNHLNPIQQATLLKNQIQMTFNAGCAGMVIPPPTSITLDTRSPARSGPRRRATDRPTAFSVLHPGRPQPTWEEVTRTCFAELPFSANSECPRVSIVVCVYNGEETIEECLDGVRRLDYPNFEVIVVDDGSTDRTGVLAEEKARQYGFRVVPLTPNGGLSAARNAGMNAASGEIIAYLDADAYPDPQWLRYIARAFATTKHAVIGGPNINPRPHVPLVDCIDKAPGNPDIVMADAEMADHVPGCNMAVRRSFLKVIGGFDPRYRAGGDDVDFCWRVLKLGGSLGYAPGAMVWHHRRQTIGGFLRQQIGYGKGEAALERDWPERFNSLGHQVKAGLANADDEDAFRRVSVYQTSHRSGWPFDWLWLFADIPEGLLVVALLGILSSMSLVCLPLIGFLPAFILLTAAWVVRALQAGFRAELRAPSLRSHMTVTLLTLLQPLVRLHGRMAAGLTPWRSRCPNAFAFPRAMVIAIPMNPEFLPDDPRRICERVFRQNGLPFYRGGRENLWHWQIEGGLFGGVRCLVQPTPDGLCFRAQPYIGATAWLLAGIFGTATGMALAAGRPSMAVFLMLPLVLAAERVLRHTGGAAGALLKTRGDSGWLISFGEFCQSEAHTFAMPTRSKSDAIVR